MPLRFVNRDFVTGIFDVFTSQKVCVSFAFKLFYASSLLTLQQHEQGWLLLLSIHTSSLSTLQPRLRSSEAVSSFSSRFIIFDSATRPYVLRAYCFQFMRHRFAALRRAFKRLIAIIKRNLPVHTSSFSTLQHLFTFSLCVIVFDSATIN